MNDITLYEKIPVNVFPITLQELNLSPAVFPLHWHEHIEINFILDGEITLRCDDKQITAKNGDCIIFNSNKLHQGLGGKKCKFACIILSPSFFDADYIIFKNKIRDTFIADEIQHIFNAAKKMALLSLQLLKAIHICWSPILSIIMPKKTSKKQVYPTPNQYKAH